MIPTAQVSVVLPTYNRLGSLPRAVRSVLGQTFRNFELILIDDGSTDGTEAWISQQRDPRIRVIQKARREGAARARNDGIRAARGELIAFQDSDDEWLVSKLEKQVALLRESGEETGWVGGAYLVEDTPAHRLVNSQNLVNGRGYETDLMIGEPFVTPTWLVRREHLLAAGLFDEAMPCMEDWDLIFKLSAVCGFRAVEEPILIRYGSADSLYGDTSKRKAGLEVILTRHRQLWLHDRRRYALWCAELGRLHGLFGEREKSRKWLREALRSRLWQPRALALLAAACVNGRLLQRLSRSRLAVFH